MGGLAMVVVMACLWGLELEEGKEGLMRLRRRIRGGQSLPARRGVGGMTAICVICLI